MNTNTQYQLSKPSLYAEKIIIENILNGTFPLGSELLNQRELATQLNVARPSLREALMRLERDGWIKITQGKPTRVLDIWKEGGLNILAGLIQHPNQFPPNFVLKLLEIRAVIAPDYARKAIEKNPHELIPLLKEGTLLEDNAESFAKYDWKMHTTFAMLSDNFIYPLLLNSFAQFYSEMAKVYYNNSKNRKSSNQFHFDLLNAVQKNQFELAETIFFDAMHNSIYMWENINSSLEIGTTS